MFEGYVAKLVSQKEKLVVIGKRRHVPWVVEDGGAIIFHGPCIFDFLIFHICRHAAEEGIHGEYLAFQYCYIVYHPFSPGSV